MTNRYFKVLREGGEPNNGGTGAWSLPTQNADGSWTPGEWREVEGELVACENALHATDAMHLFDWLGPHIYDIEFSRTPIQHLDGGKVFGRRARLTREYTNWTERTARLLACRIAEDVLPLFEREYPGDKRPRKAIEVARLYAEGKATRQELEAARYAARAAAWDAAGYAAGYAARAAAGYAARAAAWDAARYAAGYAARAAAWDAARAAAKTAAWDAAWDAARAAAWAAATQKYVGWLLELLDGEGGTNNE